MGANVRSFDLSLAAANTSTRAWTIARLVGFSLVLEAALWTRGYWQVVFGVATVLWASLWVIHSRHNNHTHGLDVRAWVRGSWVAVAALACSTVLLVIAYRAGTIHTLWGTPRPIPLGLVYGLWAVEQEFLLQSFFFVGFSQIMPKRYAILACAFLFSIAHIPNPVLTVLTFGGGYIFTALFARYRNLYIVGIAHALLGVAIAMAVPDSILHHMRVGVGYFGH